MLSVEQLSDLSKKLYVYDVEQQGWEHEPLGFEFNARHVLTHLTKDLISKNFNDEILVSEAIAPDSVQYALRLARWSELSTDKLYLSKPKKITTIIKAQEALTSLPEAGFRQAIKVLAETFHEMDHERTRASATEQLPESARLAAGYLIFSAGVQAERGYFDIGQVFDKRLAHLRERFNIPEPTQDNL